MRIYLSLKVKCVIKKLNLLFFLVCSHQFTGLLSYCFEISLASPETRLLSNTRKHSNFKNIFMFPFTYSVGITLFSLFQPQQVLFVSILSGLYIQRAEFLWR